MGAETVDKKLLPVILFEVGPREAIEVETSTTLLDRQRMQRRSCVRGNKCDIHIDLGYAHQPSAFSSEPSFAVNRFR